MDYTTLRSIVVNLLKFAARKCYNVVQTPPIKAASLQDLPNKVQLMIIEMVSLDEVLTSVSPSVKKNIFHYRISPYVLNGGSRYLRRFVLGVVGILPHLRPYFLNFLRAELIELERNYRLVEPLGEQTWGACGDQFFREEMATVKVLIAYLETGDIEKLVDTGEVRRRAVRTMPKTSERVKWSSAFEFLRRSEKIL